MAHIIDGKAFAAGLRARVAAATRRFTDAAGRQPGLAVVLVGEDPASSVYVKSKGRATAGLYDNFSFDLRGNLIIYEKKFLTDLSKMKNAF